MNVFNHFGGRVFKNAASVALVLLSMTACAMEKGHPEKPPKPEGPSPLQEVSFTLDLKGNLIIRDRSGKEIGERCSGNDRDPNVCPIFKPGHEVQVEAIDDLSIIRYHGSPQCFLIKRNGIYVVIPNAAYCSQ